MKQQQLAGCVSFVGNRGTRDEETREQSRQDREHGVDSWSACWLDNGDDNGNEGGLGCILGKLNVSGMASKCTNHCVLVNFAG